MKTKRTRFAIVALLLVLLFRSVGPVVIRELSSTLNILVETICLYFIATVFWLPWLFWSISKKEFDHAIWKLAIIPSVLNTMIQFFWVSSMHHINAGLAVMLMKSQVVWTPLLVIIFLSDERFLYRSLKFWFSFLISIFGLFGLLAYSGAFSTSPTAVGVALVTCAAIGWSSYTVMLRRSFREHDSRQLFIVIAIYTTILLAITTLFSGSSISDFPTDAKTWLLLSVSGVAAISFAHMLYLFTIKYLGATIPLLVGLLQPFLVLVLGNIVSGEMMGIGQIVFGSILLLGGFLALLTTRDFQVKK